MSREKGAMQAMSNKLTGLGWPAVLIAILVFLLLAEFFVHHHGYFEKQGIHVDSSFGFYLWFGLLSGGVLVVLAKVLGIFLKRKDVYYDE